MLVGKALTNDPLRRGVPIHIEHCTQATGAPHDLRGTFQLSLMQRKACGEVECIMAAMEARRIVDLRAYLASRNAQRSAGSLTIVLADELPFPWHTIERSSRDGGYDVYGWRTQPDAPRVAGQHPKREIVAKFRTVRAAAKAYPQASVIAEVTDLVVRRAGEE